MIKYPWAVNDAKLSAAVLHLKAYSSLPLTESAVKKEYIRRGGLVKPILDDSPVPQVDKTLDTPADKQEAIKDAEFSKDSPVSIGNAAPSSVETPAPIDTKVVRRGRKVTK
jgi:hypothetical protein